METGRIFRQLARIKLRVQRRNEFITGTIASSMASFCPTMNAGSIPSNRIALGGSGRTGAVVPASRDTKFKETACNSYIYHESETPLPSWARLSPSTTLTTKSYTWEGKIDVRSIYVFPPVAGYTSQQSRSCSRAVLPSARLGGPWRRPRYRAVTWSSRRWASGRTVD